MTKRCSSPSNIIILHIWDEGHKWSNLYALVKILKNPLKILLSVSRDLDKIIIIIINKK